MIYEIRKIKNEYYIYLNSTKILTPNKHPLKTKSIEHAKILVREIKKKQKQINSHSILSLTFFSINLSKIDKIEIIKKLSKILQNDYILFRNFNDKHLINYMNKNFGTLIKDFSLEFNLPLKVQTDFTNNARYKNENFTSWLLNLENDRFTALYKLASISDSTILSYFFIKKKIRCKRFFKLVNIEYNYQQQRWGSLDEHKESESYFLKALENINLFLKITNNF
jgi:chaperone required for assembly of F1-ATPase